MRSLRDYVGLPVLIAGVILLVIFLGFGPLIASAVGVILCGVYLVFALHGFYRTKPDKSYRSR